MTVKPSDKELLERIKELEGRNSALEDTVRLLRENEEKFKTLYENSPVSIDSFDRAALKKSEQQFRDLIENIPIGIAIVLDEKVVYRNPEQQRIFGRLPDGDFPSLYDPTTHPDDIENLREYYQRSISGEVMYSGMEFRYFSSGDPSDKHDMKWIHFRSTPIEYHEKRAVLFTMMDVTKTREMERLLNIKDRMTSLGHVAAGIAHEIRNPLSGINIYLNALEKLYERGELEKMKDVLVKIQSASLKIESVIKRVMDFSRPSEPNESMSTSINLLKMPWDSVPS
jgi:PAS domain S-box-containing protein